jgi:hypothetical protein
MNTTNNAMIEFQSSKLDAQFLLKLFYALDQDYAQALIVLESVRFHKELGFDSWNTLSVDQIISRYPLGTVARQTAYRAFSSLVEQDLFDLKTGVKNTARTFQLNAEKLVNRLNQVPDSMPGLE